MQAIARVLARPLGTLPRRLRRQWPPYRSQFGERSIEILWLKRSSQQCYLHSNAIIDPSEYLIRSHEGLKLNCPNCHSANPDGARFCLNCGNQLDAPARVDGERKYVTVLFADVVDSTGLGERLDPEPVAEIMNGAFALFGASVTKYGGTVARLLGDA